MNYWFTQTYAHIDAMNMEGFISGLTPDIKVIVGNNPPMHGLKEVRAGIGGFWATLGGLKHNLVNVIERTDGLTVLEAQIDYLRKDGKTVVIPCVSILERVGEKISSLRIYFDIGPVYA